MRRLAAMTLLAAASAHVLAETPPPGKPPVDAGLVERVTVRLLQMNFLAVDDAGRPVPDLRPEEVELIVDGEKRALAFLQPYYTRTTVIPAEGESVETAPEVTAAAETGNGRWWMLVFDHFTTTQKTRLKSIEAAKEFLGTRLSPNDRAALIVFDGGIRFVQGFTNDAATLLAAADRLVESSKRATRDRGRQIDDLVALLEECKNRGLIGPSAAAGVPADPELAERCAVPIITEFEESRIRELDAFSAALTWLLYSTAAIPEVKAAVLFSEGMSRVPSRDAADAADAVLGVSSARVLGPRGRGQIEDYYDAVAEAAAVSKTAVFTINPGGGMRMTAISASRGSALGATGNALQIDPWRSSEKNAQQGLQEIAWRTGGQATQGSDILKELERIEQLSPALYTLGFYAGAPDDPRARRKVKIRILRKDVRAEFQRDVPPPPADRTPLGGELTLEPAACEESGRRALTVRLRIDKASLRFTRNQGSMTANYSVLLRIFSEGRADPAFQDFRTLNVTSALKEFESGAVADPVLEQRLTLPCLPFTVSVVTADAGSGARREFTGTIGN